MPRVWQSPAWPHGATQKTTSPRFLFLWNSQSVMLKIEKVSSKLVRVPRLKLRTQPLSADYNLRRVIAANPEEFLAEIGEKLFLIGSDISRGGDGRAGNGAVRMDLLGLDINGRSVAVLVDQNHKQSSFVRTLLCSEWLAGWKPQDFLQRLTEDGCAELQKFLLNDIWQLNRDQRLILVAEGHSNDVLWAAQNLRKQCGIDITLLRAALAADSQTGSHYLFLRREFPASGAEWSTLVRPQEEAVDVDPDAPFAPVKTPESVAQSEPEPAATEPFRPVSAAPPDAPKQEALQTLAAGLADYLGHAIAAVDGIAELALQEAPRDPAVRRRFEEISRVVEQVGKLTDELRIFAGRGARTVQRIDPERLVAQVTESAGCLAFPNVKLRTEIDADLPQIEGDPAQLARVVSSLIENAVESLPEAGGDVCIRVCRLTAGRDYFSSGLEGADLPEGDYLSIEVSDTGFGMDDKLKARILDPFFTTKAPGRGLGLSAVVGIVRNHRGALRVESRPGAGSTFGVCLPLAKQPAAVRAGGDAAAGIGNGRTVLVVDGQESLRTLARQTFEAEGFRVLTAAEGWEALDVFAKAAATIDVVVLDWMMPDLDAEEAFRAIRRIRADTRIIVSGPFPKEQAEQRFGGKKLAAYVRKPLQAENLSECMRQLLEEQAPSGAKAG